MEVGKGLYSRPCRRPEHQLGQSIVELALVLPLLLMVVALATDLGRVYFAYVSVVGAAEQGARVGSDSGRTDGDIVDAVKHEPGVLVAIDDSDIEISPSISRAAGSMVEVAITHDFELVTPIPSALFGTDRIVLTARASHVVW